MGRDFSVGGDAPISSRYSFTDGFALAGRMDDRLAPESSSIDLATSMGNFKVGLRGSNASMGCWTKGSILNAM